MTPGTHDRVITFGTTGTITLIIDLPLWEIPLDLLVAIREHVDALAALGSSTRPLAAAPDPAPPAPPEAPAPATAPSNGQHPCGYEDCARTFATVGARAIHRSRTHQIGKKYDEIQRNKGRAEEPPPEDPQAGGEVGDDPPEEPAEPTVYTCQTCLERRDSYTALSEHTQEWHNRFPHRSERRGEPGPTADDHPPAQDDPPPPEEEEEEEPPAPRLYHCDDCEWSGDDGRDLFKHTDKAHSRQPHTWERQLRTAAERVAS